MKACTVAEASLYKRQDPRLKKQQLFKLRSQLFVPFSLTQIENKVAALLLNLPKECGVFLSTMLCPERQRQSGLFLPEKK